MTATQELKATARAGAGKGAARAVRRSGAVPGVVYGENEPPQNVAIKADELTRRIRAGHFLTTLVDLDVDGSKQRVIPREFQLDPLNDNPIHVDFQRVRAGSIVRVAVPVRFVNEDQAPGIKRGGTLNIVRHTIDVYAPAEEIPPEIVADLTGLDIGKSLHISAIALPPNVRPAIKERDFTVATIVSSSGYLEELLLAKQKAEADAAAAAAAAAAGTAVPGAEGVEGAAPVEGAVPAEGAAPAAAEAKPAEAKPAAKK
jgi:large subunit ribosomal protein L25